jgi:putative transposase
MAESELTVSARGPSDRFSIPDGWVPRAFKFEVEWPADAGRVRSHFGARRVAYNWALGHVKADMEARRLDPEHVATPWNLYALRRQWNVDKHTVAPWWPQNSKEAYSSGIADLCTALGNWQASKAGVRKGSRVEFPRFKSRRRDRGRLRFTTGSIRAEADRRTVVLPVIGQLRSKESTRRLERLVGTGRARILNATLTERWGRLFVSFGCIVNQRRAGPSKPDARVGVDLGLRDLATLADSDGNITVVPNPAPLRATMAQRRRTARQISRRIPGSRGHRRAKAKLAGLDRRCFNLRRQASHRLTTKLAATYGEIVIEDLNLAAMNRSMGRRAFRRSVSDAAIGQIRPQLAYKTSWHGSRLTVADRWFASSQIHHCCGCRLQAPRRLAKLLVCQVTGDLVDRDINAALNLRDWPDDASLSTVGADAPNTSPCGSVGQDDPTTGRRGSRCKTNDAVVAVDDEAKTLRQQTREPREGVPHWQRHQR